MTPDEALERLAANARSLEPAPLSAAEVSAWVARAEARAGARRATRSTVAARGAVVARVAAVGALLAVAAVALVAFFPVSATRPAEVASLERVEVLGDRVVAAGVEGLRWTAADAAERRVEFERGELLFDVRSVRRGEEDGRPSRRFVVVTGGLEVTVRGTVFSVRAEEHGAEVRVFEGVVAVRDGGEERALRVGDRYARGVLDGAPDARLVALGHTLAWQRAARQTEPVALAEPRGVHDEHRHAAPGPDAFRVDRAPSADVERAHRDDGDVGRGSSRSSARFEKEIEDVARPMELAEARRRLARGEAAVALAAARTGRAREPRNAGEWRLIEADALRALGRIGEAVVAYEAAVRALSPSRAAPAGLVAATLSIEGSPPRPAEALALLDRSRAAEDGSPVEGPALSLRVQVLRALGRLDEARRDARRYVARFPGGSDVAGLSAWLDGP